MTKKKPETVDKPAGEAKPCPFCRFQPDINEVDFIYPVSRDRTVWGAHCYDTGGGCNASVLGNSAEDALRKWNRRPVPRAEELDYARGFADGRRETLIEAAKVCSPRDADSSALWPSVKRTTPCTCVHRVRALQTD